MIYLPKDWPSLTAEGWELAQMAAIILAGTREIQQGHQWGAIDIAVANAVEAAIGIARAVGDLPIAATRQSLPAQE